MPDRFVHVAIQLDANRINSKGQLEHVNQLERWRADGVILLEMSEVAHTEASAGADALRRDKAYGYIFSITAATTTREREQLAQIEAMLCPGGAQDQNQRNDVEVVFNAIKYGRILVTNDGGSRSQPGGILGNADRLRAIGLHVMRDVEAVAYVRDRLATRDRNATIVAEKTGQLLPDWVGRD